MYKNLFTPMYGDDSAPGRFMGFFIRFWWGLFGLIASVVFIIPFILFFLLVLVLPFIPFYGVYMLLAS
ncbi:MAG: hypothetical protein Q9M91_05815 [Candidatus Dojkabacteria bacterium]|nr:hypothetical protein [Candidatus Dojkabacteria bacterium]MDQ7021316.1 hypothetical protein [Candidatus Dojkabacteria bacterium]